MKITFLGTGAADWPNPQIPVIYDSTAVQRRCSSILVNSDLLVDPGPDVPDAFKQYNIDYGKIENILLTHSHEDHFSGDTVKLIGKPLHAHLPPYRTVNIGGYEVTPLVSTHIVEESDEIPLFYVIERDGKRLFYGCDGAWFTARTWEAIDGQFNCVILDSTFNGAGSRIYFYHNSAEMVKNITASLEKSGYLAVGCKVIAQHLSRRHFPNGKTANKIYAGSGIIPAFDGMVVEV